MRNSSIRCICFDQNLGEVAEKILTKELDEANLDVGTACGLCLPYLKEIINVSTNND
jgi:bacterioferritin-associated ferredoxin